MIVESTHIHIVRRVNLHFSPRRKVLLNLYVFINKYEFIDVIL